MRAREYISIKSAKEAAVKNKRNIFQLFSPYNRILLKALSLTTIYHPRSLRKIVKSHGISSEISLVYISSCMKYFFVYPGSEYDDLKDMKKVLFIEIDRTVSLVI